MDAMSQAKPDVKEQTVAIMIKVRDSKVFAIKMDVILIHSDRVIIHSMDQVLVSKLIQQSLSL
jgi:hypothetical protein